jgi:hypothetical protein
MTRPDRAPNVALQAGDVVIAAEGGLVRLDREMKPQRILVLDELANARGIAVEPTGKILVSTRACNAGAIVRVDPGSGALSLVATGFKTTKSILIEPGGTLLVSDEVGGSPWGYLWRLNLQTGEQQEVHRFSGDEVATGIGVDAQTGDVFFTRRGLYRLSRQGVSRMAVDGVLQPTNMTMFRENLLVSGDGPPAIEMKTNGELIGKMESGGPVTSLVARGDDVFIGYGNGRVGRIKAGTTNAENVWEGKPSNVGVFVAVVPERPAR